MTKLKKLNTGLDILKNYSENFSAEFDGRLNYICIEVPKDVTPLESSVLKNNDWLCQCDGMYWVFYE